MKKITSFLFAIFAFFLFAAQAQDMSVYENKLKAYDSNTVALSKKYIEMMGLGNILDKAGPQIRAGMIQQIKAKNPTISDVFLNRFVTVFYDEGLIKAAPLLEKISLVLVLETFTPEEIKAQYDFYSTPVGQSIIKKLPVYMGRIPEIQNVLMTHIIPPALQKAVEAVKKDGFDMKL